MKAVLKSKLKAKIKKVHSQIVISFNSIEDRAVLNWHSSLEALDKRHLQHQISENLH